MSDRKTRRCPEIRRYPDGTVEAIICEQFVCMYPSTVIPFHRAILIDPMEEGCQEYFVIQDNEKTTVYRSKMMAIRINRSLLYYWKEWVLESSSTTP